MKTLLTVEMYGAIQVNGKIVFRAPERRHQQQLLLEMQRWLATCGIESRNASTIEYIFSKKIIAEQPRTADDGIDYSNIPMETDEEAAQRILDDAKWNDPKFYAYMHITPATIGDVLPETLADLRNHMRTHYPQIDVKW